MYSKIGIIFEDSLHSHMTINYALSFAKINRAQLLIICKKILPDSESNIRYKKMFEKFLLECNKENIDFKIKHLDELRIEKIKRALNDEKLDILFYPLTNEIIKNKNKLFKTIENLNLLDTKLAITKILHISKTHLKKTLLVLDKNISKLKDLEDFIFYFCSISSKKLTLLYTEKEYKNQAFIDNISKLVNSLKEKKIHVENLIIKEISGKRINLEASLRHFGFIITRLNKQSILKSILFGNPLIDVLQESPCNVIILKV